MPQSAVEFVPQPDGRTRHHRPAAADRTLLCGRSDRRALPAPDPTGRVAEETFVAPTLIEHYQLILIWEELLDAWPIRIRDNFFYLEGHSLVAARLVKRIEQIFGKKIPLCLSKAQET